MFHEFSLHLVAAVPNALFLEYVPWWDVLFEGGPQPVEGAIVPPTGPGTGLRFNRDAIKDYRVK